MPPFRAVLLLLVCATLCPGADDPTRVFKPDEKPKDYRLGAARTLNGYFPMTVPADRAAWDKRRTALREQVLVANGLWPMPSRGPLNPVVHGKIDRDGYTVEKVYFASLPGHYVSGNLYRPKDRGTARLAGVLCPHGHWANGRFFDAGEETAKKEIKAGAEKTVEGARYPLQARCAQLARMGCVVFHYDMVGYADSRAIGHRAGFTDAEAELRLQSAMGLQTWNSIRALDFLLGLPEVDPDRIGVTGASGGGTQTFILCGIDDRPTAAFPAVMVSTAMQGGCICENCSYLRQDAGNIDLAALFAPKPLAMSGAKDWTIDIETKGLPELKKLYRLYEAEDRVMARCFPEFGHNYNQVSREVMYNWFNKHLRLGHKSPVEEKPFVPVPPKELSVYDDDHPVPKDAVGPDRLRQHMTTTSDEQIASLVPQDSKGVEGYRKVLGPALRVMIGGPLPAADEVEVKAIGTDQVKQVRYEKLVLSRKGKDEQVPAVLVRGQNFDGTLVVWVHPEGKASLVKDGALVPAAAKLLEKKAAILALDVLGTGELKGDKLTAVDKNFAGYTFGYNRPLLANRVHDVLTAVGAGRGLADVRKVHLAGFGSAGPWVMLARGLCGDAVTRTAADMNEFRFENVKTSTDEMMLPGALKYGGLPMLASLAAPAELLVHNHRGTRSGRAMQAVYTAAGGADRLVRRDDPMPEADVLDWLLR